MANKSETNNVSRIVLVNPEPQIQKPIQQPIFRPIPPPRFEAWAPAWFYSALNWLGKSYYDASNVSQSFSQYMAGSDVDPYSHLGSTRLFIIFSIRNMFRLSLAVDSGSFASASASTPTVSEPLLFG
jgi:hypothetical protein